MYCWKCHRQLPDGSQFCYFCGAVQDGRQNMSGAGRKPRKMFRLGNNEFDLYDLTEKAAGAAGFVPLLPLALGVLVWIFRILAVVVRYSDSLFNFYLNFAVFFFIIRELLLFILIIVLIAEMISLVLYMTGENQTSNQNFYTAIGTSALACLSLLFGIYSNSILSVLFAAGALMIGMDLFVKVFIDHRGFSGTFDIPYAMQKILSGFQNGNQNASRSYSGGGHASSGQPVNGYASPAFYNTRESWFDGNGVQVIGYYILCVLISMLTCGLAAPWGIVQIVRWRVSHTIINGRRQYFNGTATGLFGLWIKWILLSLITCGIYAFFAYVDYKKWETRHTSYGDNIVPDGVVYMDSEFTGNSFEYLGYAILTGILSSLTCGIAGAWCAMMLQKWEKKNTVIRNQVYTFDGTGGGYFLIYLTNVLLTTLTCGIYGPWAIVRMQKYIVSHTHVQYQRY